MWTRIDANEKKLISYAGNLPSKLFRYRTLTPSNIDRIIDFEIIQEAVYLAGLKDLNDPDEGRFLMKYSGSRDDIMAYWRKALQSTTPTLSDDEIEIESTKRTDVIIESGYLVPEDVITLGRYILEHVVRVACFTTQAVNYSMWANYAKYADGTVGSIDHGGICIEYLCDDSWRAVPLHPVEYSDSVPEINLIKTNEDEIVKAFFTKSKEWRCEDEWRIMLLIQAMPPFQDNLTVNSKIRLENSISSIIFGLKTPKSVIDKIRGQVSSVKPNILYKQVIRNQLTFNRELIELT